MAETLLSVGLDVGTTTTQLVVSRITVENRASGFCVPQMDITDREILYESPVRFTPLVGDNLVNGEKIAAIVEEEYKNAGIKAGQVDTGAVIVTGETSRKENAAAVVDALSVLAGDFVVATAGPDLESILAAKGAGAVAFSETTEKPVVHIDIGGGTANLCCMHRGQVLATGCLNVGGRLVKISNGKISYVSPVLQELTDIRLGDAAEENTVETLAQMLTQALEMAVGLRKATPLLDALWTKECEKTWKIPSEECVFSFSGGVADCIGKDFPSFVFGDIGPVLGRAIRESSLCRGEFMLGKHTIRATVIGAGCYSAQLSGSTVFCRDVKLPLKNLAVAAVTEKEQTDPDLIARRLAATDSSLAVLALPGYSGATYAQVEALARAVTEGFGDRQILVCLQEDMAKALGQRLFLLSGRPCLCIDRIQLSCGSYLDVGQPVGPCMPVVVKTLVFQ